MNGMEIEEWTGGPFYVQVVNELGQERRKEKPVSALKLSSRSRFD